MRMSEWIAWIIVAVLSVMFVMVVIGFNRLKKENAFLRSDIGELSGDIAGFEAREPYYVDQADRSALANFIGDNLDDVSNPHRGDVIRILAEWGSTK